jgi:Fe-S-cluster containining protein
MFNMKAVETKHLDEKAKFNFRCYPGIKCFTKCCSNIDIMLTPYDVLRLKNRLEMTSGEFLDKHTMMRIDDKSTQPYAYLKMEGEEKLCPFLGTVDEGCTVYEDRPVSCRYYPVGQGTLKKREGEDMTHEEFYFFVREPHCKGYEEDTEWTIAGWREDQKSAHWDEMNRGWKEVMMRRNLPGKPGLDEMKQMQFFMASYDLDRFRHYVFDSRFLDLFEIPEDEVKAMREDEVALMKFAFKYVKFLLMMEETLKLKKGPAPKAEGEPKEGESKS